MAGSWLAVVVCVGWLMESLYSYASEDIHKDGHLYGA